MTAFVFIDSTNMQETILKSGENGHFGVFYEGYIVRQNGQKWLIWGVNFILFKTNKNSKDHGLSCFYRLFNYCSLQKTASQRT